MSVGGGRVRRTGRVARDGCGGRDRGQTAVLLIGSVVVVVVVAIAFLVPFGSVVVDKRVSSTAADAAALAAVGGWRDSLRGVYDQLGSSASDTQFYSRVGAGLGSFVPGSVRDDAASFAARNSSELVGLWVDGARGAVTVRVRSVDVVPGTSVRAEATSTARLRFTSGLCVSGGVLGVKLHGACRTTAPAPTPTPTPTPTPSPTGTPGGPSPTSSPPPRYRVPDGIEPFAVTAVLTTS